MFLNGSEYRTSWHADSLRDGEKVGFLVTNAGDIVLFVDGEAVVHIERTSAISWEVRQDNRINYPFEEALLLILCAF